MESAGSTKRWIVSESKQEAWKKGIDGGKKGKRKEELTDANAEAIEGMFVDIGELFAQA